MASKPTTGMEGSPPTSARGTEDSEEIRTPDGNVSRVNFALDSMSSEDDSKGDTEARTLQVFGENPSGDISTLQIRTTTSPLEVKILETHLVPHP